MACWGKVLQALNRECTARGRGRGRQMRNLGGRGILGGPGDRRVRERVAEAGQASADEGHVGCRQPRGLTMAVRLLCSECGTDTGRAASVEGRREQDRGGGEVQAGVEGATVKIKSTEFADRQDLVRQGKDSGYTRG